jgi:hypothetical protein
MNTLNLRIMMNVTCCLPSPANLVMDMMLAMQFTQEIGCKYNRNVTLD